VPTAADSLLKTALASGVEICFANPGTTEMPLVAALDRSPGIRPVLGLFEGVCSGCADGWGRMRRQPAMTLLHLGPGFANSIANLHNARRARTPVVNLIGDHTRAHAAFDSPLHSDIESLARPVSTWFRHCRAPGDLGTDTAEAIAASKAAGGGVASLVIPADVQWGEGPPPAPPITAAPAPRVTDERILEVARRLRASSRCGLLLGSDALGADAQRAAARIASAVGAKLWIETFPARWERGGDLPAFERLPYFPEAAREALADLDLLILAGARAPVAFFGYPGQASELAPAAAPVLLSEPQLGSAAALEALADEVGAAAYGGPGPPPSAPVAVGAGSSLDPVALSAAIARCLPENAIVIDEAATSGLPFYAATARGPHHSVLTLTGGAIGQGLPCAAGAALACPDRRVLSLQADGSAQYTLQALFTLARESLDVTVVLFSNRSYRILQIEMARAGISEPGAASRSLTQLTEPELDWSALARGYGVPAERVTDAEGFGQALERALSTSGPTLIEAIL